MAVTLTSNETEQSLERQTMDEVYLPAIPRMENLRKLFQAPEGCGAEEVRLLNEASSQIIEFLRLPAKSLTNTLTQQDSALQEGARKGHELELNRMCDALSFLDTLCSDPASLNSLTEADRGVIVTVKDDVDTGLRILVKKPRDWVPLGHIFDETVMSTEIVIRTGKRELNDKTPMQLNFRFLKSATDTSIASEISSLRVDLHNRADSEVQLDVDLPTARYLRSSHQRIPALSAPTQVETQERFSVLLNAFGLNFVSEKIMDKDRVQVGKTGDKHQMDQKHMGTALARFSKYLNIYKPQEITIEEPEEIRPAGDLEIIDGQLSEIHEIFDKRVAPRAIYALAKAINAEARARDSEIIVLGWLLKQSGFKPEELVTLLSIKERLGYLTEFLQNNYPNSQENPTKPLIYDESKYTGDLKVVFEKATSVVIAKNDVDALEDIQKIVSFMAFFE